VVHHAFQAVKAQVRRRRGGAAVALACCAVLAAGCGGSSSGSDSSSASQGMSRVALHAVNSVRAADCTDWKKGSVEERRNTVRELRKFAGGPVGSSAGIQTGPVLGSERAYRVLQSYCKRYFARGFKLYKLYDRAAAFVGRSQTPVVKPGI
jgi:hypothetical protein